jgi:hypothetical protein
MRGFYQTRGPNPLTQDWLDEIARLTKALPLGCVLGTANLVNVLATSTIRGIGLSRQEIAFGDYRTGRYGWLFEDVEAFSEPG